MAKIRTARTTIKTVDFRTVRPPAKTADPFYASAEWRKLMDAVYAERGRVCQECGRTNCRLFGDHIRELQDGGQPLDPINVKILCGSCHTSKTAAARAARLAQRY